MSAPRRLGVLGGMGPAATVDLLDKIVSATQDRLRYLRDQDHVPVVVWSDPRVPPRSAAILASGPSPLPAMREGFRALEGAGAEGIAMPCNTAHHWADALMSGSPLELLHIADAVVDALERRLGEVGELGLMATTGTVRAGFYGERLGERGFSLRLPDAASQERIGRGIDAVKSGAPEAGTADLVAAGEALLEAGAGTLILACTEIPIGLRGAPERLRARTLDATRALAERCVAWSLGD